MSSLIRSLNVGLSLMVTTTAFWLALNASANDGHHHGSGGAAPRADRGASHPVPRKVCNFSLSDAPTKKTSKGNDKHAGARDHNHNEKRKNDQADGGNAKRNAPPRAKGHQDENDHDAEGVVRLSKKQTNQVSITSVGAGPGVVVRRLLLTAEISLNANRVSQISSSVSGRIVDVRAVLGQRVKRDDILAVVQSQELAGLVAEYLAARERLRAAAASYQRENRLRQQKISSEQAFLAAQEKRAVARIKLRSVEGKLKAIGMTDQNLAALVKSETTSHRYPVAAPLSGTIIHRTAGLGERTNSSKVLFRIADLRTVWVIASVYQNDLANVRVGQPATVRVGAYKQRNFRGRIAWVSDVLDERTRTLKVRIEVANTSRLLKPGMFANASVSIEKVRAKIVVPTSAVIRHRGENVVFVQTGRGEFRRKEVTLGLRSSPTVQILSGVSAGDCVVMRGAFTLKSELDKGAFKGGHAH